MKNIKHLLATAIVALVALTAPLQSRASLLFNGTNSKAVLDEPFGLTATVAGEAAGQVEVSARGPLAQCLGIPNPS